jgi:hypothetical protein
LSRKRSLASDIRAFRVPRRPGSGRKRPKSSSRRWRTGVSCGARGPTQWAVICPRDRWKQATDIAELARAPAHRLRPAQRIRAAGHDGTAIGRLGRAVAEQLVPTAARRHSLDARCCDLPDQQCLIATTTPSPAPHTTPAGGVSARSPPAQRPRATRQRPRSPLSPTRPRARGCHRPLAVARARAHLPLGPPTGPPTDAASHAPATSNHTDG